MAGPSAHIVGTFDGGSFAFVGIINEPSERPCGVTPGLNGAKHFHAANYVLDDYFSMAVDGDNVIAATHLGHLATDVQGTFTCGLGSCTARIKSIDRTTEAGDPPNSQAVHMLKLVVTFQRLSAWS
jgi:hypothetical protein